ncbi:phosphoethanolamine transferase [Snodgrassella sp. CFCC 13594]|uniref:phosphoethanolamine transferase n=1 Tax=Snodgrassella sp. CFCC 13594 TaxID=1775559 RepID=UPI00082CDC44|nr:phosphoethanolamine transferase [Snodgrassella sp. CFCC 13594]
MTVSPKLRYAIWLAWLLVLSVASIYALAYPPNPNRIVETWFFLILLHRFCPQILAWVLWLLAVIIALYHPTAALYGRPSFGIVASLLSTSASEAQEYLSAIGWSTYLATVVLAFMAGFSAVWVKKIPSAHFHWLWSAVMLLAIAIMTLSTAKKGYTVGGFPMRVMPIEFLADAYFQPKAYFAELAKLKADLAQPDNWTVTSVHQPYRNYVLVVGESMRSDYMQLYGFKQADTPFLQQHANVVLDNMYAAGPNTPIALLYGLSLSNHQGFSLQNNLMSLANKAGMQTAWLSNQGALGQYDTTISAIAHQAHYVHFLKTTGYDFGQDTYDDQLIPWLKQALAQPIQSGQNRLIVLHLIGSHPNPCDRIRSAPHHYVENKNSNCYIDSIAFTDQVLKQIYQTLGQTQQPFSMLYFSDHGLSHDKDTYEKNELVKSSSILRHNDRYRQNYHIPLVVVNSDGQGVKHIRADRTGFYLMDGLAAWLGLSTPQLPHSQTFFGETTQKDHMVLNFNKQVQAVDALPNDPLPADLQ